jgi:hypothetical protein
MTLAMVAQVACTHPTADEEEVDNVAEVNQGIISTNALSDNALSDNALSDNALSDNALSDNALSDNALSDNALLVSALTTPSGRELFSYVVSCALPAGAHVNVDVQGTIYGFDGSLGLASEWGEPGGSCDDECKSWVSGCVISRLDYLGQTLDISLRGKHPALKTTPQERAQYDRIEATYYGNIFTEPKEIYACLPPGKHKIPRVCGPSLHDCIVDVQGRCDFLCGDQRFDGAYPKCREAPSGWWWGSWHQGEKHVGSVTVFLEQ